MRTLPLGKDGPLVPAVCFGTYPLGDGFGAIPESQAIDTVHAALDAGLTFIDTAEGYASAEVRLGKALKGRRHEAFLATKLSRADHSPDQIDAALDASLRALQTDYIDLYQIHFPDRDTPIEETLRALDDLVHQGKVRYIGCSNYTAWQLCEAVWTSRALHLESFVSAQPNWSMVNREIEQELVPFCQAYNM
ncbi:MAG: aldo/keto reductase, partial [Chloroflexi bacterium]|nr:aldo/keto reductase [Chloroflexota bacterium]